MHGAKDNLGGRVGRRVALVRRVEIRFGVETLLPSSERAEQLLLARRCIPRSEVGLYTLRLFEVGLVAPVA